MNHAIKESGGQGEQLKHYHRFRRMNVRRLAINAVLLALLIISSKISIATPLVPFTMQLFVAFIIAFIAEKWDGVIIFIIYIMMGLIGLPVFTLGGGIGYIYLIPFGYIIGFLIMDIVIIILKKYMFRKVKQQYLINLISSFIGLIVLYVTGFTYAMLIFNVHLGEHYTGWYVLEAVVFPFILFDSIKCIVASIVSAQLSRVLVNR